MERLTSQKEFILEYLKNTKSHPTAEQVFREIREKIPRISLGTIYRNLDNFSKKNLLKEIPGEKKRYDGDLSPHHHFICRNCNEIFDIVNIPLETSILEKKTEDFGIIEKVEIITYGLCKKCK